jgi:hypothetical protein
MPGSSLLSPICIIGGRSSSTDKGRRTLDAAMRLQAPWVNKLSGGLSVKHVKLPEKARATDCDRNRGQTILRDPE